MSSKILLLEDDVLLGETLSDLLEDEGYEVLHVTNGQDALEQTFKERFELYILDINVPLLSGTQLLKELREGDDQTPAIFLTSHKTKDMLSEGFLSGCDDYITKPFDNDELLFRISAVLRRVQKNTPQNVGKLKNDTKHKQIFYDGEQIELSKKEYELLSLLMLHVNQNLTKEMILSELWSCEEGGSDGAIRVYINRLKHLFPDVDIQNVRGIGYRLVL